MILWTKVGQMLQVSQREGLLTDTLGQWRPNGHHWMAWYPQARQFLKDLINNRQFSALKQR